MVAVYLQLCYLCWSLNCRHFEHATALPHVQQISRLHGKCLGFQLDSVHVVQARREREDLIVRVRADIRRGGDDCEEQLSDDGGSAQHRQATFWTMLSLQHY